MKGWYAYGSGVNISFRGQYEFSFSSKEFKMLVDRVTGALGRGQEKGERVWNYLSKGRNVIVEMKMDESDNMEI